jgi:leucyl-tRNA synthetase
MIESSFEIVVSINGKVRDKIKINLDMTKEEILGLAKKAEKITSLIEGKIIIKEIYVPKKLVNLVVK